jgi:hypothetical protein
MEFFLSQFGFSISFAEVESVLNPSKCLRRLAGDAGHAFLYSSNRIVLLGFVNLNEWGGSHFRV